ncbi:hypothetical protein RRG08_008639 [Elysia crispata]|uniref:Uncharacterized protein n=1 Tax=Elysia crispata TaxID=231223 RepID=A0AAE1CPD8_9GAST|nr:hypothetical protein RRG08_008639 [Elysia crispata]
MNPVAPPTHPPSLKERVISDKERGSPVISVSGWVHHVRPTREGSNSELSVLNNARCLLSDVAYMSVFDLNTHGWRRNKHCTLIDGFRYDLLSAAAVRQVIEFRLYV